MKPVATTMAATKAEEAKTPEKNDAKEAKETKDVKEPPIEEPGKNDQRSAFKGWLRKALRSWPRNFFAHAPQKDGAALEW